MNLWRENFKKGARDINSYKYSHLQAIGTFPLKPANFSKGK